MSSFATSTPASTTTHFHNHGRLTWDGPLMMYVHTFISIQLLALCPGSARLGALRRCTFPASSLSTFPCISSSSILGVSASPALRGSLVRAPDWAVHLAAIALIAGAPRCAQLSPSARSRLSSRDFAHTRPLRVLAVLLRIAGPIWGTPWTSLPHLDAESSAAMLALVR